MKILCFGDSITFGEMDTEHGGWVDQLKDDYIRQYANSIRQEVTVYNLGIGGETTDGLRSRFATEFSARSVKGQETVVILSYGINDIVIHKGKNIVPVEYFVRNLKSGIDSSKLNGASIVLSSMTPISDSIDGIVNQHNKLRYCKDIERYNSVLQRLATEKGCLYLDIYREFNKNKYQLLSKDGVHPNSEGHRVIYKRAKNVLKNEMQIF